MGDPGFRSPVERTNLRGGQRKDNNDQDPDCG